MDLAHGACFRGHFLLTLEARSGSLCALGAVFAAFRAGVLGADFRSQFQSLYKAQSRAGLA